MQHPTTPCGLPGAQTDVPRGRGEDEAEVRARCEAKLLKHAPLEVNNVQL